MRPLFFLALGIPLLAAASAGADVAVAPIEGDGDPALLAELQRSLEANVAAVPFVVPGRGRSERSTAGLSAVVLF